MSSPTVSEEEEFVSEEAENPPPPIMSNVFDVTDIVHPECRVIAEEFKCCICHGLVLEDPVQTVCSHIFFGGFLSRPVCRGSLPDLPNASAARAGWHSVA